MKTRTSISIDVVLMRKIDKCRGRIPRSVFIADIVEKGMVEEKT